MNNYDKVLDLCKSNDELRPFMTEPFLIGDLVYSTNGYVLCRIDKSKVERQYQDCQHSSPLSIESMFYQKLFNDGKVEFGIITPEIIEQIKSVAPMVDEYEDKGEDKDCEACDGSGQVDYEFDYEGRTYYHEDDCPLCDGDGLREKKTQIPTGKKTISKEGLVKIGESYFRMEMINILFAISELMQSDIKINTLPKGTERCQFGIKDIDVIVMPIFHTDQDPFYTFG